MTIVYCQQDPAKVAEVKSQISQHFPEVFEHPSLNSSTREKRLRAIMCYAQHYTGITRYRIRHELGSSSKGGTPRGQGLRQPSSLHFPTSPSSSRVQTPSTRAAGATRASSRIRAVAARRRDRFTADTMNTPTSASRSTSGPSPCWRQIHFPSTNIPSTSSIPAGGNATNSTSSPPTSTVAPSVVGDHYNAATLSKSSGSAIAAPQYRIDEVIAFLRSCTPDMGYLLESFITFGCRNREFLVAVGRRPDDQIEAFLRGMVACTNQIPGSIPEMDLWVLKNHFKNFVAGPTP
ncbi:hypothetical protein P691DRAFT_264326 [Macrolepiota fuliginosa MF-IS2]|uniref:Uncharacterized protein n=1 Tax=Macrolepiota fuliginosa MF-IS2 TaxID=1400762 RepID=A0A9P5X655_9AGAR|nr:hypothetical protein P691DRAFT_264326 [Macrolepiota fuliginosa MF-IS2]